MNEETKELEAGDVDEYGYTLIEERDALEPVSYTHLKPISDAPPIWPLPPPLSRC